MDPQTEDWLKIHLYLMRWLQCFNATESLKVSAFIDHPVWYVGLGSVFLRIRPNQVQVSGVSFLIFALNSTEIFLGGFSLCRLRHLGECLSLSANHCSDSSFIFYLVEPYYRAQLHLGLFLKLRRDDKVLRNKEKFSGKERRSLLSRSVRFMTLDNDV